MDGSVVEPGRGVAGDSVLPPDQIADPGQGHGPDWLDATLAARLPELVRIRRTVHAHPELSRAESATTALILRTLAAADIRGELLSTGTGVVAEIGSGPRAVGLRADIDALPLPEHSGLPFASTVPRVAHACGHDVHLTVLLGTALALAASPDLPGRIRLVFQPAEEIMPGGSHNVVASGALDGLERIFALHCDPRLAVGQVGLKSGPITSTSDLVEVSVSGPGGHTARPHLTADIVYALGTVITGLGALLGRRMDPRWVPVMTWGAVHAGEAANTIPQTGSLRGTLRMMDREGWDAAHVLVPELIAELVAPTGVTVAVNYRRGVPPVVNDPVSAELLRTAALAAVGPAGLAAAQQSTGAEDFAIMLEHLPGALARLGVWDGRAPQVDLHSAAFRADERAIPVGVRLMVHAALAALAPVPPPLG